MNRALLVVFSAIFFVFTGGCSLTSRNNSVSDLSMGASRMIKSSQTSLKPVYAPLAEHISQKYHLQDKDGIGIDLGSGPGTLIIEFCKRTKMRWVNADINPCFFDYFFELAAKNGFNDRVSAIYADAHNLPFRDNYADFIVSRGSYHFWNDKEKAFKEIYRVLKPGGVAYIGRGFSENLPVETAKKIRTRHKWNYDPQQKAEEIRQIMEAVRIKNYSIIIPRTGRQAEVNYGIWVEINK